MQNRRVLVLLGMPGVGKGTQAQRMAKAFNLFHIDTGKILRDAIASGSELGSQAQGYVNKGQLVPFSLVMDMIKAAMMNLGPEQQGYLFDGFPRNLDQAEGMNQTLDQMGLNINAVLYLETPYELLFDRLAYRLTCSVCDTKFNLKLNPPTHEGICDVCGGALVTRKDDQPDVIENRLKAYQTETAPLIDYYTQRNKLTRIDANQSMDAVFQAISNAIAPFFTAAEPQSTMGV